MSDRATSSSRARNLALAKARRLRQLYGNWIHPGLWRRRFLFNAQRSVMEPRKREVVAEIAGVVVRALRGRPFSRRTAPIVDGLARTLNNQGYVRLGPLLSPERCGEIREWLRTRPAASPYHPELGKFLPDDAPEECHVLQYPEPVILDCPHLYDIANDPRILALAEQFLGAKPTISNLALWWSLAGRAQPKEAQLFHRDVDDVRFCKLFVYLTDVDMMHGPHVFVKNSPPVNLCTGLGRFSDQEVEESFGSDAITYFCGSQGEAFIVNTYGVHKGLLPRSGNRLLFQVQYSLFPIFLYDYAPVRRGSREFPYDPYVNRLYVRTR